ncbi:unnamed protein product, partial [Chrysoparadoxa australica]
RLEGLTRQEGAWFAVTPVQSGQHKGFISGQPVSGYGRERSSHIQRGGRHRDIHLRQKTAFIDSLFKQAQARPRWCKTRCERALSRKWHSEHSPYSPAAPGIITCSTSLP